VQNYTIGTSKQGDLADYLAYFSNGIIFDMTTYIDV
jgi:hypothetical protein